MKIALESQPAPILIDFELHIRSKRCLPGSTTVDLFGGVAPRLQRLCLKGAALKNWESPVLSGLHFLSIHWVQHGPSRKQLL